MEGRGRQFSVPAETEVRKWAENIPEIVPKLLLVVNLTKAEIDLVDKDFAKEIENRPRKRTNEMMGDFPVEGRDRDIGGRRLHPSRRN